MLSYSPRSQLQLRARAALELQRRGGDVAASDVPAPQFRGGAQTAQSITAPAWMLSGPSETGKTWGTLWRLDSECRRVAGGQFTLIRKTRTTISSTVLVTFLRIQELREQRGETPAAAYGGGNPEWFTYPNGTRLWIGGMDDPSKILSGERDGIYVNQAEELTEDDWETLSTRATGRGAKTDTPMLFGDCNPGPADHWIIRRRDSGALTFLESTHRDNPSLYTDAGALTPQGERSMAVLRRLTGVRKLRLADGLWVGAEGQFFEQWDEAIHVREPVDYFVIPADWPVWGAFDYGFSHNTAFGVYTRHDGTVEKLGEHVANKLLPSQNADAMDALLVRIGIPKARLRRIVAGHDAFVSKGDSEGKTIADQYKALGYTFVPAQIDRINGAAQLLTRLGNQATDPPTPATLRIWRRCTRAIVTIPAMVHDPHRPEDVLKVDAQADGTGGDDAYDETRYGLMDAQPSVGQAAVGPPRPQTQTYKPR